MTFQFSNHSSPLIKFCFLFGKNLLTSPSQELHNFWFKKYGLNYKYNTCILHEAHEFIDTLTRLKMDPNFLGGNVTMPFKQTLVESFKTAFKISETVKNTTSANTIFRNQNGDFQIENTDVAGIQKTLRVLCPDNIKFQSVLIYGAGGASASCIYAILKNKFSKNIICFTRDIKKSYINFCKSKFFVQHLKNKQLVLKQLNSDSFTTNEPLLIVNTLPLGSTKMYPEPNEYCMSVLKAHHSKNIFYFDLVYDDTDAYLLSKKLGFRSQNGLLMFKTQAALSFKLWTGVAPL